MKLVFATHNEHKFAEVTALLPEGIDLVSLEEIGCFEEIQETAETLEGNSLLKARYVHDKFACDVFSEDTGLEIEGLKGAPGVYSARFAGPHASFQDNIDKVLEEMKEVRNRRASFRTVFSLIIDKEVKQFEGVTFGTILSTQKGDGGFGYDPIFLPDGSDRTFGEMTQEEKASWSHRAKALKKLIDFLILKKLSIST